MQLVTYGRWRQMQVQIFYYVKYKKNNQRGENKNHKLWICNKEHIGHKQKIGIHNNKQQLQQTHQKLDNVTHTGTIKVKHMWVISDIWHDVKRGTLTARKDVSWSPRSTRFIGSDTFSVASRKWDVLHKAVRQSKLFMGCWDVQSREGEWSDNHSKASRGLCEARGGSNIHCEARGEITSSVGWRGRVTSLADNCFPTSLRMFKVEPSVTVKSKEKQGDRVKPTARLWSIMASSGEQRCRRKSSAEQCGRSRVMSSRIHENVTSAWK